MWIWRKNRVKKIKNFIDHILLLFDFEKKYFEKENIKNTFVGQPLRVILTGSKFGPGLYDILISLGKEEVDQRLGNKIIG